MVVSTEQPAVGLRIDHNATITKLALGTVLNATHRLELRHVIMSKTVNYM